MPAAETRATFTVMEQSTGEDWAIIGASFVAFAGKLPDRVLAHLRLLDGDYGGFAVDRLQHSLQTATLRAPRRARTRSTSSARCSTTSATRSARSTTPTSPRRS